MKIHHNSRHFTLRSNTHTQVEHSHSSQTPNSSPMFRAIPNSREITMPQILIKRVAYAALTATVLLTTGQAACDRTPPTPQLLANWAENNAILIKAFAKIQAEWDPTRYTDNKLLREGLMRLELEKVGQYPDWDPEWLAKYSACMEILRDLYMIDNPDEIRIGLGKYPTSSLYPFSSIDDWDNAIASCFDSLGKPKPSPSPSRSEL
jgi:hypothetical protein